MQVNKFETTHTTQETTYSVHISYGLDSKTFTAYIKIPRAYEALDFPHNAFLVLLAPLALSAKEHLHFDGPVSPKLFESIKKLPSLLGILPINKSYLTVSEFVSVGQNNSAMYGQFFTLGLDSFHTLLSHTDIPNSNLKYLIYVDGFDIKLTNKSLLSKVHSSISEIAARFKLTPIIIQSNIRALSDSLIDWEKYHGAALAASALSLEGKVSGVLFNSSDAYLYSHVKWGTGVALDSLWSTESMWFKSFGVGLDRYKKALVLSNSKYFPLVLGNVRVCWQNDADNNSAYNCCKCEKCLRTYLLLQAVGAPLTISAFKSINLKDYESIQLPDHIQQINTWKKACEKIGNRSDQLKLHNLLKKRLLEPGNKENGLCRLILFAVRIINGLKNASYSK
jgi:hypothetical protein